MRRGSFVRVFNDVIRPPCHGVKKAAFAFSNTGRFHRQVGQPVRDGVHAASALMNSLPMPNLEHDSLSDSPCL